MNLQPMNDPAHSESHVWDPAEDEPLEELTFDKSNREETEMDMTPMVDVTFLLLIFFMVTAAFSLQKSLETPTPENQQPSTNVQQRDPEDDPSTVTVRVDEYNTFHVITTDWEAEAPSVPELMVKLREAKQGDRDGRIPNKLLVMAHVEALHEKVVAALDAGSAVKMEQVQLMTVEDDE